jgi:hypothetical protein
MKIRTCLINTKKVLETLNHERGILVNHISAAGIVKALVIESFRIRVHTLSEVNKFEKVFVRSRSLLSYQKIYHK